MLHPVTNDPIELTKEQQNCVNYQGEKRKDLVIRSAAGGGKSLVLIERARNYLNEAKAEGRERSVVIFTYNRVLAHWLKEWMMLTPEDEKYIKVGTLHEYLVILYDRMPGGRYDKLGNPAYQNLRDKLLSETLSEHGKVIGSDKYIKWGMRFWYEEFTWMRNLNFFNRSDRDRYLNMKERVGRGHTHRMDELDRRVAFEMFCKYQEKLREKKIYDDSKSGDERILYITHNADKIPDQMKFDHVLIDEAQDQTLAKIIALKQITRRDITICMDANQRIYEGRWTFSQADIEPTSKRLSIPFRCTGQIDALAESLKEKNQAEVSDEDKVEHVRPTATGEKPEIIACKNVDEERRYIIALLKKWLRDDPDKTIGIMCFTNDAVEKIGGWLSSEHIYYELIKNEKGCNYSITGPGIKLCTIHTSKGLEFMRVILPQFYQGMIPQNWAIKNEEKLMQQRNVAYVGMTRAMHQLVIIYSGRRSMFIDEMDPELYVGLTYEDAVETELNKQTPMYQKRELPEEDYEEQAESDIEQSARDSRRRRWSF
ncbi:3'-5' exonuclease [Butyrivibrio sp. MC2013]|uniref:3'-5' exonuclease n=1 Tax=Butyrivibrio sp. MC2013 TaxID=1280686 RepID=UPI0004175634|nr:3'-5' exonuclease [Butyrivibrio sp. MC2013]